MDEPNVEAGQRPVACPMCGEVHLECSEAILSGMELSALSDAKVRLSSEGIEALRMVVYAAETLPGGWVEAWDLAKNIDELHNEEIRIIEICVARLTQIGVAREELYEDPAQD